MADAYTTITEDDYSDSSGLSGNSSSDTYGDVTDNSSTYDPNAPVHVATQNNELIYFCVLLGLTIICMAVRTFIKVRRIKKLRSDDYWMLAAFVFVVLLFISQVMDNRLGGNLPFWNIRPENQGPQYLWEKGFVSYFIAVTLLKISVCTTFLQIIPFHLSMLRKLVVGLCCLIGGLGLSISISWLVPCRPFMYNFDLFYSGEATHCIDTSMVRWCWSGLSIVFDLCTCAIPFTIFRDVLFRPLEKIILLLVFTSTFAGTVACGAGVYGFWKFLYRPGDRVDMILAVMNDVEILVYTIAATLPLVSPFLLAKFSTSSTNSRSLTLSTASSLPSHYSLKRIRWRLTWKKAKRSLQSTSNESEGQEVILQKETYSAKV